jgi:serine-type D-Ala-D-Ala carboxypeptidase/endopeptidase (penicillin-binding protein 4)
MDKQWLGSVASLSIVGQLIFLLSMAQPSPAAPTLCPAEFEQQLTPLITQPGLEHSTWGIALARSAGPLIYGRLAGQFFVPASTQKLLTTAVALRRLGPEAKLETAIVSSGSGANLSAKLMGQGDPSLGRAQLLDLAQQLAQKLKTQGPIDRLTLNDEPGPWTPSTWQIDDSQSGYGAPINRLIFEENAIGLSLAPQAIGAPLKVVWDRAEDGLGWKIENRSRTGSRTDPESIEVTQMPPQTLRIVGSLRNGADPESMAIAVLNPGDRFQSQLQQFLAKVGVLIKTIDRVEGPATVNSGTTLASVRSPRLADLIRTTNQSSNNLYAEALVNWLGRQGGKGDTSHERGRSVITQELQKLGLRGDEVAIADGSGLSRHNLITPAAQVKLLQAMAADGTFRSSLPVAGRSGGLRSRFVGTSLVDKLQAKTGSMSGIMALTGYLTGPDERVFTIVVNGATADYGEIRLAIDSVVLKLSQVRSCSASTPASK